jgi:hypothetical protein
MAGVYRMGNQSWKKHISAWVVFVVFFLVIEFEVGIAAIFYTLFVISFASKTLVYLFNKFYEAFVKDNYLNSKKESKEWFFGMITSVIAVTFIIVGALIWDGIDPFENDDIELTFKSVLGFVLLTLGLGLPFLGLVSRLVLSDEGKIK